MTRSLFALLTMALLAAQIPPDGAMLAVSHGVMPVWQEAVAAEPFGPPLPPPGLAEVRGLWVDAFNPGIKTPAQVEKLVADAELGGINTLLVQVRRRGDRYFLRGNEPLTEDPDVPAGFDPLAAVLEQAHSRGLEVHAWVTVFPTWRWNQPPRAPEHVYNRHGPAAPPAERWVTADARGMAGVYLDPGHPEAVAYLVGVLVDLVRQYPVDGLHLDYIRYDGQDLGYNETSLARFNARHGRSGRPEPRDPAWSDWRREQVTQFMRRVYLEVMAVRPRVKVSAALVAWGAPPGPDTPWEQAQPYWRTFQDWRAWLEEGILDLALPMNYFQDFRPEARAWYDGWVTWQKDHAYGRQVASGVGMYFNYLEDGLAQVAQARTPSAAGNRLAGVALYSYAATHLYGNRDYAGSAGRSLPRQPYRLDPAAAGWLWPLLRAPGSYPEPALGREISLPEPPFAQRAPVPPMPWKEAPTTGHVAGVALDGEGRPRDGARVTLAGAGLHRETTAGGSGWYGFAHLPPGEYTLTVAGRATTVGVAAGQVTRAAP